MIVPVDTSHLYVRPVDGAESFPLVAVSILNWNGWQDTIQCLESVRRLDYPNYLTIVVDNGSTNGSADKINAWAEEKLGPGHVIADCTRETALADGDSETEQRLDCSRSSARMVLIRNQENLGFAGGNNVSIYYALSRPVPADYVFLLNNDATVDADCLRILVAVAKGTGAGITGAYILGGDSEATKYQGVTSAIRWLFHPFVSKYARLPNPQGEYFHVPSANGEGMMLSAAALRNIYAVRGEYLNTGLFMYLDEFDIGFRISTAGYKTVIATRARVRHIGRLGTQETSARVTYYQERNRILVANEVLPFHLRLLFHLMNIPLLAARFVKLILRGRRRIARALFTGQLDGYRGVRGKWKLHDRPIVC